MLYSPIIKPGIFTAGGAAAPTAPSYSIDLERGSAQFCQVADGAQTGLDVSGDFTFEMWVKFESLTATNNDRYMFMAKDDQATPDWSYNWTLKNTGGGTGQHRFVRIDISGDGSAIEIIEWTWLPVVDTWYHIALTCDISAAAATQHEFFVDTVSQGNGTVLANVGITSIHNSSQPFHMGGRSFPGTHYFDGKIADARVWDVVRSGAQIAANWKLLPVGNEANLVSSWAFGTGSGTTAFDSTANGNDLTLTGAPAWSADVPYVAA